MKVSENKRAAASKKKLAVNKRTIRDLAPKKRDIKGGRFTDPGCLPNH
jgi:hypothetical protein